MRKILKVALLAVTAMAVLTACGTKKEEVTTNTTTNEGTDTSLSDVQIGNCRLVCVLRCFDFFAGDFQLFVVPYGHISAGIQCENLLGNGVAAKTEQQTECD